MLKPSGDGSEGVIESWSRRLSIKLVVQRRGNVAEAAEMGLRSSSCSYVLFVDDDAIPRDDWVERYVKLFENLPDAGGIGGLTYKAFLKGDDAELVDAEFYPEVATASWPHRRPLPGFEEYCEWVSPRYSQVATSISSYHDPSYGFHCISSWHLYAAI